MLTYRGRIEFEKGEKDEKGKWSKKIIAVDPGEISVGVCAANMRWFFLLAKYPFVYAIPRGKKSVGQYFTLDLSDPENPRCAEKAGLSSTDKKELGIYVNEILFWENAWPSLIENNQVAIPNIRFPNFVRKARDDSYYTRLQYWLRYGDMIILLSDSIVSKDENQTWVNVLLLDTGENTPMPISLPGGQEVWRRCKLILNNYETIELRNLLSKIKVPRAEAYKFKYWDKNAQAVYLWPKENGCHRISMIETLISLLRDLTRRNPNLNAAYLRRTIDRYKADAGQNKELQKIISILEEDLKRAELGYKYICSGGSELTLIEK